MKHAMLFLVILFISKLSYYSNNAEADYFDVRQHPSTVTRYVVGNFIADSSFVPSHIPQGFVPIHLNLLARHGTRSPTKKRITESDALGDHLKLLIILRQDVELDLLQRFPNLFDEEYHPEIYTINATRIPRATVSAMVFGMGLFSGKGSLGPGTDGVFAVTSGSNASDMLLAPSRRRSSVLHPPLPLIFICHLVFNFIIDYDFI